MRKIIVSSTLLVCLASPAYAMGINSVWSSGFLEKNSLVREIGWDQKNLDVQTRSVGHLIARIKKLKAENEQLRNSISLIRAGKTSYGTVAPDPRIQGLIDENKRLMAELDASRVNKGPSANFYLQKINTLKEENQKLSRQIEELNVKTEMGSGQGGGIMDDTSVLKAYMEENQALKEALEHKNRGSKYTAELQEEIKNLKAKNEELKLLSSLNKNVSESDTVLGNGAELARKDAEISALKKELLESQEENRQMSLALVETTQKAFNSTKNADKAEDAYKGNLETIELLKKRLSNAQKENRELHAKLELTTGNVANSNEISEEMEALRQQNESLRETIKAQSESLHAADNASKTAERLLTENAALQHKLTLAQKTDAMDSKTAQEMIARIKTLEKEITRRDVYIKKMLAAKAEELAALSESNTPNAPGRIASLQEKNVALVKALDKEKESNIAYRRKISEYQKELEHIKEVEQASSSGVHRAGIFERHVKTLEKKQQQSENTIAALKLENQELKARLDLVVAQQTGTAESVSDIEPALGEVEPNAQGYEKGVTFLDSENPSSSDGILPILEEEEAEAEGKEEKEASAAVNNGIEKLLNNRVAANRDTNALLATEIRPLSEMESR